MENEKIMVIDDDKEFLEELQETLRLSGYDLVAIDDPVQALELAKNLKPSAILVDLKMPKKSGFEFAYELKNYSKLEDIPVIAMSAYFKDEENNFLALCGISKLIRKPFNPLDIISSLEEALAERRKKQ